MTKKPAKNVLEWSVFAFSAALVLAVVAILAASAAEREPAPPDLRVSLGEAKSAGGGTYAIPVRVRNAGGRTAAAVRVEVALEKAGERIESSELTLAFVPAKSDREGWAVFHRDPACCAITTRPVGFESP
jgi:uncharacterized protein (TIGR02588 family)